MVSKYALKVKTFFTKENLTELGSKIKYEMVCIGKKINELSTKVKKYMKKD
jgi:hypothetical protein